MGTKLIAVRVDASLQIGMGHLMRCLSLVSAFSRVPDQIHFLCRDLPDISEKLIRNQGCCLHRLESFSGDTSSVMMPSGPWLQVGWAQDADAVLRVFDTLGGIDVLIVDHYGIDAHWEKMVGGRVSKILIIDDLANRPHRCDWLLDQNFYFDMDRRYGGLVNESTRLLLGPSYALLHPEFASARKAFPRVDRPLSPVKTISICFGGVDSGGETLKVARLLVPLIHGRGVTVELIVGRASPHLSELETWVATRPGFVLHVNPNDIPTRLAKADIGIGAPGSMVWERASLGLPSLTISVAENQESVGRDLARFGAHLYLGRSIELEPDQFGSAASCLLDNPWLRQSLAHSSLTLVDGQGARRVARRVLPVSIKVRVADEADMPNVHRWRNHPNNRRFSHTVDEIGFEDHQRWFRHILTSTDHHLLIGEDDHGPVGVLRYDRRPDHWLTSIYLVPSRHGEGLGTLLLTAGIKWLYQFEPQRLPLHAEIRPDNKASLRAFENAGYVKNHTTYVFEHT